MLKKILISLFISVFTLFPVHALGNNNAVRVAISDNSFTLYNHKSIEFLNAQNLEILSLSSGEMISGSNGDTIAHIEINNGLFEVKIDNQTFKKKYDGFLTIRSKDGSFVEINGLKRAGKQSGYRGIFELVPSSDGKSFYAVNILDVENYLRGVVPNEMPVRFGLEALKAQSVAARNYALAPRIKQHKEFDLCDSVAAQVYFGANTEKELSDRAVEQTEGIIALSPEDKPILALYSSTGGGYSGSFENSFSDRATNKFPSRFVSYLQAIPDNPDTPDLSIEENAKEFYTTTPKTFDNDSPYFRWSRQWTNDELEKVLKTTLKDFSSGGFVSPALKNSNDFGKLENIIVNKRDKSGKVVYLEILTDKNIFVVSKELIIRRVMKHNGKSLPSANFVIYKDKKTNTYTMYGGGFGHGVGMSQWGAGKMSALGYNFEQILNHYYKGIRLTTLPENLTSNKNSLVQNFYSNSNSAWVYVVHNSKIKTLFVEINNTKLEIDLKNKPQKVKINISDFIVKGRNQIRCYTDDRINEQTSLNVYVEIKGSKDNGK